jgi:trimeric autotransporter adhesin
MKVAYALIVTVFLASLIACGGGSRSGSNGNPPTLTALAVTPTSTSMGVGSSQQFTATGKFSDGSSSNLSTSVQWTSSNSSVAFVGTNGMATGVAVGASMITATSGSMNASATLNITSQGASLKAITISPTAVSLPVNTAQQFTATGSYSDGSSRDITFLATWSSSALSIATVTNSGLVQGIKAGSVTISASAGGVKQTTTVTVTAPTISFISVSPDGLTLPIGINQQYIATATYTDGTSQDLVSGVTWNSSSTSVATINGSGLAMTTAAGATTIQATVGSFTDSVTLTVVNAHLSSISVAPSPVTIAAGTNQQFAATGIFDDGSTQTLTSVTWSSSAPGVVTVDSSGLAAGVAAGTGNINATVGSITGSAAITVTGASLVSIAVTPANSIMPVGASKQFVATGTFSDSSTQDITASVGWSSSDAVVAAINSAGLVTSTVTGTTKISAILGAITGSTGLTVSSAKLTSISITPANPKIAAGTSIQLHATGKFSDGSSTTNLSGVTWKSSKPNIASPRSTGIVRGKKSGSVTISASLSGITGTTTLTVGTGILVSITVTPPSPTVVAGQTQQFVATGSFNDGSTQDITIMSHWSSSVASVATIANAPSVAGLATTSASGAAVITANSGGVSNSTTMTVN